jgi:hypothetical protein
VKFQLKHENETNIMRYVTVEKTLLDAKNLCQSFEKKIKDLQREIELLNGKIKQGANDKTRICGILDDKVSQKMHSYLIAPHSLTNYFLFLVSRTAALPKRRGEAQIRVDWSRKQIKMERPKVNTGGRSKTQGREANRGVDCGDKSTEDDRNKPSERGG